MPANDTLLQALEPLRLRYLDSPVPAWLRAAGETLLGLLPLTLRRQLGAQQRSLLLQVEGGELRLHASVDGSAQLLGCLPTDNPELLETLRQRLDSSAGAVPRWLLVAPGQVLRRSLTLPTSAETRLRDVLLHEIDRQTPFSPDQVSYEARVLSRDAANKQLRVELVVIPNQRIETALAALGPMNQGLAGIDVRDADGGRLGVNLLPATQRTARVDRAVRINLLLGAVIVIALLLAMWLALGNRRIALEELNARVAAANVQAREVRKLRNTLDNSTRAANFLARQRAQQPTMLALLADLTRRIPDNTALEKLSVNEGHVVLIGKSQQAAALVALLQASPLLRTPALAGAVQSDPATGRELFTMTATVVGSPQEAADAKARKNP
ncbi:MAG TPA: PilN domain-containing protein [Arenimonas sp.]|uniref:PilN domain-containing protein n=1 Tax=Arenimonas sp. TaxID=1872635 RepID=UPI002C31A782|nr:PilN domain-containing protein [Arenimonas sp.]HMB57851.1 PilN domain-containing protein [Arenimonas sp.]